MNRQNVENQVRGSHVAAVTPMTAEGDVDYRALTKNLRWYLSCGLSGALLLGSTGEQVHLTEGERVRVLETAREVIAEPQVLIAGVGMMGTRLTILECRRAAEIGADLALVVTPNYYQKAMTTTALAAHYRDVADASPIPVLLYSVPGVTNITLPPSALAELASHPNIAGMKNSGTDAAVAAGYADAAEGESFSILSGSVYAAPGQLLLGQATGVIFAAANVLPEAAAQLVLASEQGDVAGLHQAASVLRRLSETVGRFGIAGWKEGVRARGHHGGPVRAPLRNLTAEEQKEVVATVEQLVRPQ